MTLAYCYGAMLLLLPCHNPPAGLDTHSTHSHTHRYRHISADIPRLKLPGIQIII